MVLLSQPAKEWLPEMALALLQRLLARGWTITLTTAPRRPQPSLQVARQLAGIHRLPSMPLRALLGFVAAADAVLTVDGAIAHCSVALGTPTLALFGPTIPSIWFPYACYGPFRVLHGGVDCGDCDRFLCPTKACTIEAAKGKAPRRPYAVNYVRCMGCGLCEIECRKIVFGEPALYTFSHGRGQPTVLRDQPTEEYTSPEL